MSTSLAPRIPRIPGCYFAISEDYGDFLSDCDWSIVKHKFNWSIFLGAQHYWTNYNKLYTSKERMKYGSKYLATYLQKELFSEISNYDHVWHEVDFRPACEIDYQLNK